MGQEALIPGDLGLSAFFALTLAALIAPALLLRGELPGRRARRRRMRLALIAMALVPLMAVGPETVYALHVQSIVNQAVSSAVLGAVWTQRADTTHTYDDNGNLTGSTKVVNGQIGERLAYIYDAENRLTEFKRGYGQTAPVTVETYGYDADAIRRSKIIHDGQGQPLTTTRHLVDKNRDYAQVLAELTTAGVIQVRYVHGDDLILQARGPTHTDYRFYHTDGQLSSRFLTHWPQSNPAVTDWYTYEAFGTLIDSGYDGQVQSAATDNVYRYTGEQYDAETGLYYFRARYYQSITARFASLDPLAGNPFESLTLHKYVYASADPVNKWDPSGQLGISYAMLARVAIAALIIGVLYGGFRAYKNAR